MTNQQTKQKEFQQHGKRYNFLKNKSLQIHTNPRNQPNKSKTEKGHLRNPWKIERKIKNKNKKNIFLAKIETMKNCIYIPVCMVMRNRSRSIKIDSFVNFNGNN